MSDKSTDGIERNPIRIDPVIRPLKPVEGSWMKFVCERCTGVAKLTEFPSFCPYCGAHLQQRKRTVDTDTDYYGADDE